jgi:Protein of unknown function (DUF3253)
MARESSTRFNLVSDTDEVLSQTILDLLNARKSGSTICPSDVPRALFGDWRIYMPQVRRVALGMARAGSLEITQAGKPVDLPAFARGEIRGPIRLRLCGKAAG